MIKVGVIGLGYIGPAHIEALSRIGGVRVCAVADINKERAHEYAGEMDIDHVYCNWQDLVNSDVDVVHNCTPNHLHFEINKSLISAGKHIISEKPLCNTVEEARELDDMVKKSGLVNAVNFNYRYYPLVQHAAGMVRNGELGKVFAVQGCYMQDWLFYSTDWNWRLETQFSGKSRAIADIGSHWFDLIQFIIGKRITKVFADLLTVHKNRFKPHQSAETFSQNKEFDGEQVKMQTEDYGHILLEFEDNVRSITCISQVSSGRKNHIVFEVDGTNGIVRIIESAI